MRTAIIRYPGSNCDYDALRYFPNAFFIWHKEVELPKDVNLVVIPGGFAFGDRSYLTATGVYTIAPGEKAIVSPVTRVIKEASEKNITILGICNGFQILVDLGLLPGKLIQNNNKKFHSKVIKCKINQQSFNIPIANGYGNYQISEEEYQKLVKNKQIFMTYEKFNNGSIHSIAGVCNKKRNIFGMMPHPERLPKNQELKSILLNNIYDYHVIDNEINRIMNSEHVSYKSTKQYLRELYTEGDHVIQGPGENAGIIDIGNGYALCLRIESHNHPIYIEPYDGAATGVGGILRDIFTMGARPIALLDFLRFGTDKRAEMIEAETIRGISEYGNCVGVPVVGGEYIKNEYYNHNPLLNVACIGIVKKENIIYGNALRKKSYLVYVGSKTGMDGVGGADMASKQFNKGVIKEKDSIQKGDPFLEKLLLEACCELADIKIEGMQDMGAGGVLCASMEVVVRGRKKTGLNLGCELYIDEIPIKEEMAFTDILISESQERMLIVANEDNIDTISQIFKKWDLEFKIIGMITDNGNYTIKDRKRIIYEKDFANFEEINVDWEFNGMSDITYINKTTHNSDKWSVYDNTLGGRTLKGPLEEGSYAILDLHEINKKLYITWGHTFEECNNKMDKLDGEKRAIVNCLNYGHPQDSMEDLAIFVQGLSQKCQNNNIPVIGGNVSLYNSTENKSIPPSPMLMMVGIEK
jgi:phosphoribosylformylglycinamidine synthase II/phosphoribosylformylglycinamidine synthase I